MAWDDQQYLKFADERTRAARELLARVPLESPERVVDLGCGPGNSTLLLRERYPEATLWGVDNSPEMLARARVELAEATFVEADLATYQVEQRADLLFANAVLQWLPAHETLVPSLFGQLGSGGVLAFQVPVNFEEPSQAIDAAYPARTDGKRLFSFPRLFVVAVR